MAKNTLNIKKKKTNTNKLLQKTPNQTVAYNTSQAYSAYRPSKQVTDSYNALQKTMNSGNPTFNSKYTNEMASAYNKFKNRGPFEYDMNNDALYQQYAKQYKALGNQAMQDTMGQAAQLSGGYGNSYASSAGQQAYNSYLQQLNDIVPQLYSQAYDKYNQEGQDILNTYNLAQQMYGNDWDKYQSDLAQYNTKINQLMDMYNTNATNDLNVWNSNSANNQWALEYALNKENQAFNQAMQNKEYELSKAKTYADIENTKASTAGQKISNAIAKKSANAKEAKDLEDSIYKRLEEYSTNPDKFVNYLGQLENEGVIDQTSGQYLYQMFLNQTQGTNNNTNMNNLELMAAKYGSASDSNAIENYLRTLIDNGTIDNATAQKWYKKYHN